MTRVKKLTLAALAALALTAGAVAATSGAELAGDPSQWGFDGVAKKGSFDSPSSLAGDPSQWGFDGVAKKGSFDSPSSDDGAAEVAKVNEYEGQHRVAS